MSIVSKQISLGGRNRFFNYRDDSAGDLGVLGQVIDGKCFDIDRWHQGRVARAFYNNIESRGLTPLIVDAGANIGSASVFFSQVWPKSQLVSLEPQSSNFSLLKENTTDLNIDSIEGGIGPQDGFMFLEDPGLSDWGFRLANHGDIKIPVYSMKSILARHKNAVPFIAKIDIEGGEINLFDYDDSWFYKFAVIIFETHDWMMPFKGISDGLMKTVSKSKFDILFHGENIYFFNHDKLLEFHNLF
jgi:FkbM family methyltransferase